MNKRLMKERAAGIERMKALLTATIAAVILAGMSGCSTASKPETPVSNITPPATPVGAPPPKSSMTHPPSKVPKSLVDAGEFGENIYDMAKANNWTKAATTLASLKNAIKQLHADLAGSNAGVDQLDKTVATLDQAIAAKDRQAAMREANQVTRIVADVTAPFNPRVPIEVTRLDYQGRELEVWAGAKDSTRLKATADEMQRTWEGLRPQVESHGGSSVAKRFNDLVAQVEAAKTADEYARLAKPILDEVDHLEKVFEK